jgi:hypothetical protein
MVYLKWAGVGFAGLMVVAIVGLLIAQRVSDGPMSIVQGGPFKTGELVEEEIRDWSFAVGKQTEFELVGFGTAREAGFVLHEGVAYMTCDLGFMWRRLDPGVMKTILNVIYIFKHWHTDAVQDGRVLLRVDGEKIYRTQFVKVEDPVLIGELKSALEIVAAEYFGGDMGPRPVEPPNDIWFFRMDPR